MIDDATLIKIFAEQCRLTHAAWRNACDQLHALERAQSREGAQSRRELLARALKERKP